MNYQDALECLKRGEKIARNGRIYSLGIPTQARGLWEITDPEKPRRVVFDQIAIDQFEHDPAVQETMVLLTKEDLAATDWEAVSS